MNQRNQQSNQKEKFRTLVKNWRCKKDLWKERGLSYTDLEDMNFAEKISMLQKLCFPKPDYQKLVDEGMPVKVAYFIKIVRDALPTKPTFEYFEKIMMSLQQKN